MSSPNNEILSLVISWMNTEHIKHFCATFEAECQYVCLEQLKIVDGVVSTDGDCITHCVSKFYYEVNFEQRAFLLCDREIESTNVQEKQQC